MLTNDEMRAIMTQYGGYLTQLSYMYVKDWTAAEDVVQESFIKYFKAPDKFEGRAHLKSYLAKIVIHTSTDYLRSWKSRKQMLARFLVHTKDQQGTTADAALLERIGQTELLQVVLKLPLKYREAIILFYYEDMTTLEIAQILQLPENTIKTRLRRARQQLKTQLTEAQWEVLRYE